MVASFSFDQAVVQSWNDVLAYYPIFGALTREVALWGVYLIPVLWLVSWFFVSQKGREMLLSSIVAGVFAWQGLNAIVKQFVYHARPSQTLPIREWLFERPDNSFPSDHAAFLAAIAFFFFLQRQKLAGAWLFVLAVVVSMARVAVAVHYPSDIAMAFLTGLIAACLVQLVHPWLARSIWVPLIAFAKRLKLA